MMKNKFAPIFLRKSQSIVDNILANRASYTAALIMLMISGGGFIYFHGQSKTEALKTAAVASSTKAQALQAFARLPLRFEEAARPGQFIAKGIGYGLALEPSRASIKLHRGSKGPGLPSKIVRPGQRSKTNLQMQLVNANSQARALGVETSTTRINYLLGNDPSKWRTGVPNFDKVKYEGVYPGIDLVYYGNQQQLEYDFIVSPGAQPQEIKLEFPGASRIQIDQTGNLVLEAEQEQLVQHAPIFYQESDGTRVHIEGGYVQINDHQIGFRIGDYDRSLPLVIDPVLSYSTYLGGNGDEFPAFLALDEAGNIYIQGNTTSTDLMSTNANSGSYDAFVAKLNPNAPRAAFITYLGGTGDDFQGGIAIDQEGNVYLGGNTTSSDFPTKNAIQPVYGGDEGVGYGDAYVAKLDPSGTRLLYSTYLGGSSDDTSSAIALDRAGNVYITGATLSSDFPIRHAAQPDYGGGNVDSGNYLFGDAFVTKINPSGSAMIYSTYLGGSGDDGATNIFVDRDGAAYISGGTLSSDFPVVNAFQSQYGGVGPTNAGDGFLAKLSPNGRRVEYATYLGGSNDDIAWSVALDEAGAMYVVGGTASTDFPVRRALQPAYGGIQRFSNVSYGDAFITKFSSNGKRLEYSTFLGGSGNEVATGLFVDPSGHAYVSGQTSSANFPLANPTQSKYGGEGPSGAGDGFVARLSAAGDRLLFSTYLGGSDDDWAWTLKVNRTGDIYLTGFTVSTDFPVTPQAIQHQKGIGDSGDGFVTRISASQSCQSACLYAPEYWLLYPHRTPSGVVYLDQFFPVPSPSPAILIALRGGFTPMQNLQQEYVALQLSLLNTVSPSLINAQPLSCLNAQFSPLRLSTDEVISTDLKVNEFLLQIQEALRRHNQEDLKALTEILDGLHGAGLGGCNRAN